MMTAENVLWVNKCTSLYVKGGNERQKKFHLIGSTSSSSIENFTLFLIITIANHAGAQGCHVE